MPGPNNYSPKKHTETNYAYSFPLGNRTNEAALAKASIAPGPGAYEVRKENPLEGGGKSILGGSMEPGTIKDNMVPGPGQYSPDPHYSVPGFVIMDPTEPQIRKDNEKEQKAVGPQTYAPKHPTHTSKAVVVGTGTRDAFKQHFVTPGPDMYSNINNPAYEKPRFHMGIRTNPKGSRAADQPGPGEYETDVIPLHHACPAHIIGTSVRSDLGVGRAYQQPGPGQYDAAGSMDGPKVGFGTEKKNTKIKKTYAPGPGSYNLPTSVGHIPPYLLTNNGDMGSSKIQEEPS